MARRRDPDNDTAALWATVLRWLGLFILVLLASTVVESIRSIWQSGWHLQFDRVSASRWAFPTASLLPFLLFGGLLVLTLARMPMPNQGARWLAGSIGMGRGRRWVLLLAVPLVIPLFWLGPSRLGDGVEGYPSATWGTLAVVLISLAGLAASAGVAPSWQEERRAEPDVPTPVNLPPWPESMTKQGIQLAPLTQWTATSTDRHISAASEEFMDRLRLTGARAVAPQLVDAVRKLMAPQPGETDREGAALLFGPDDCGQVEVLALAATEVAVAHHECTLIVTPRPDAALQHRLERHFREVAGTDDAALEVLPIHSDTALTRGASIWMVDAATLSDDLMILLAHPATAARVGLVVWWDAHRYTGVLAANTWAISRRLNRVLSSKGAPDLRTLVFARDAPHAAAQLSNFVKRLLPYPFPEEREVHVDRSFPRAVHLHRLVSHLEYFQHNPRSPIQASVRHPALVCGVVSASLGWPTCLSIRERIPEAEMQQALNQWAGGDALKHVLAHSPSEAGARILQLDEEDVLALAELVAQGGRAAPSHLPHHVALAPLWNPYADYVIARIAEDEAGLATSRRLVGAEGHPSIFRRHLLLALSEQEDTRTGLKEILLWDEATVEKTLREIADKGKLSHREVRFVNADLRRMNEYLYTSHMELTEDKWPLDTVGENLKVVRSVTEGNRIALRVDEKRLPIQAHPGRVFMSGGSRYVVRDWGPQSRDWVECQGEPAHAQTWRRRQADISKVRKYGDENTVTGPRGLMRQYGVKLQYAEFIQGYIRREFDLTRGTFTDRPHDIEPPLTTRFETTALIVEFKPDPDMRQVLALCQGLRHVFPVHLGVDPDAIEIVPVEGMYIDSRQVFGFAIVDLYPHGIGLVDAICDDPHWVLATLRWTRDWLDDLVEKSHGSLSSVFRSPLAVATSGGGENPLHALELLAQIVEPRPVPVKPVNRR
jgi:hypothetical protein